MVQSDNRQPTPGLVSIIVPARNAGPWIDDAVSSALAQTHPAIEVIVVDNGSTDDTRARVARVAASGAPVRLIEERLPGPSAARNAGLDAAAGEYVQFLDADDAMTPWKVERQLAFLRSTRADVAWAPFVRGSAASGQPLEALAGPLVDPALDSDLEGGLLRSDGFLHVGATLSRRAAIGHLRFDRDVRVVEDVRFLLQLSFAGARFARSPGASGYVMREHSTPGRASRADGVGFWTSSDANVQMAEERWAATGTLTASRVGILTRASVTIARNLIATAPDQARIAMARARRLTPRYYEAFPPHWRPFVRALGFEGTERLAKVARSMRTALGR